MSKVEPQKVQQKQISQQEYRHREEWAPHTLKDYHCPPVIPPVVLQQPETMPPKKAHHPAHKRSKPRSSSLYEEWKAQASRNMTINESTLPAEVKAENQDNKNVSPVNATAAESTLKALKETNAQGCVLTREQKNVTMTDAADVADSNGGHLVDAPAHKEPSNTSNTINNHPAKTPVHKRPVKNTKLKRYFKDQTEPRYVPESYTAPNGCCILADDLWILDGGVKNSKNDTVYFHPSFLEDPWEGLKPIKTECLARW